MFYVDKGELYLSAAARCYAEVKELEKRYVRDKDKLSQVLLYIRYVYVKRDNEAYWNMPPLERSRHVVRSMQLLGCEKKSTDRVIDTKIRDIEKEAAVAGMIALCRNILLTDKGRIIEDLRRKIEVLRSEYMEETDHDKLEKIYKSMTHAQGLLDKYQAMDGAEDSLGVEYLFELPEHVKPYNLKIIT